MKKADNDTKSLANVFNHIKNNFETKAQNIFRIFAANKVFFYSKVNIQIIILLLQPKHGLQICTVLYSSIE